MATIPQIVTSPGAVPSAPSGSVGGGMPRVSPQMDIPTPLDPSGAQAAGAQMAAGAYESEARSGAQLATYGEQFADQYIKAKLNVDAANRTADLSAQLHEAEFQSSKIADRDAAGADFDARVGKIRDDWNAQDVNPKVRAAVDANLPNQIALRRASTQNAAFGLESQTQVGQLITNLDQYNKQAVDAQDPRLTAQLIAQANQAIDGRVAGGWLSPEIAARMKVDFGSNVTMTKIELAMAKNPQLGIALYEATKGQLNAKDAEHMGVIVQNQKNGLEAQAYVRDNLPVFGGGGGGFDNNTGNITASSASYSGGKTGAFAAPSGLKFETFASPEHGVAAQFSLVKQKVDAAGGNLSFAGLVAAWDPPASAEVKANYAKKLADAAGLKPGDNVPIGDEAKMAAVLKAQNQFEKGKQTVPDEAFVNGIKLAKGDTSIKPTITQQGDSLAQLNVNMEDLKLKVLASDKTLQQKMEILSQIQAQQSAVNGKVTAERKMLTDETEKMGVDIATGKYTIGSFGQMRDKWTQAGDTGMATAYDVLAQNEEAVIAWTKAAPGTEDPRITRLMASVFPGKGAAILKDLLYGERADRTVYREQGADAYKEFQRVKGLDGATPQDTFESAARAVSAYGAANDPIRARQIYDEYMAHKDAFEQLHGKTPSEIDAKLLELRDSLGQPGGFSPQQARVAQELQSLRAAAVKKWKDEPQVAADVGPVKPYNPNEPDLVNQNLWANTRTVQTRQTAAKTGQPVSFLMPSEIAAVHAELKANPAGRAGTLQKLAQLIPPDLIKPTALALASGGGDGKPSPLGNVMAEAMMLFRRNGDGDAAMASSLLNGVNAWKEGGAEGNLKVNIDRNFFNQVENTIGANVYRGLPQDRDRQNDAVAARYVDLIAGDKTAMSKDTPDAEKLNQAVTDVIGAPLKSRETRYNDEVPILPSGIKEYQWYGAIERLTEGDMPPLQPTLEGQAITLADIKNKASFRTAGDGTYTVMMKDPKANGMMKPLIRSDTGRPWVIDMNPIFRRATPEDMRLKPGRTPQPMQGAPVALPGALGEPVPPAP